MGTPASSRFDRTVGRPRRTRSSAARRRSTQGPTDAPRKRSARSEAPRSRHRVVRALVAPVAQFLMVRPRTELAGRDLQGVRRPALTAKIRPRKLDFLLMPELTVCNIDELPEGEMRLVEDDAAARSASFIARAASCSRSRTAAPMTTARSPKGSSTRRPVPWNAPATGRFSTCGRASRSRFRPTRRSTRSRSVSMTAK